jgi:hypothetical protein
MEAKAWTNAHHVYFEDLEPNDTFDLIDPGSSLNSFFKRCRKVGTLLPDGRNDSSYVTTVYAPNVRVFHVILHAKRGMGEWEGKRQ